MSGGRKFGKRWRCMRAVVLVGSLFAAGWPCARNVLAAETAAPDVKRGTAGTPQAPEDKGVGALALGDLYRRWGDEQAAAAYAEAARSSDPLIRKKALDALIAVHGELPWEASVKRLETDVVGDSLTLWKGLLFGLVAAIGLACLWVLLRCGRILYDGACYLCGDAVPTRQMEVASLVMGSQEASSTLLMDAFSEILWVMQRQRQLAQAFAPQITVVPQMRGMPALGELLGAAFELGERSRTVVSVLTSAWSPRPRLRVDGSALTVGDRCHVVLVLRDRERVIRSWARSLTAADVLDGLKDIAYAALLAAPTD
jgi:hypothetical protein